jgi:hypothetical protein
MDEALPVDPPAVQTQATDIMMITALLGCSTVSLDAWKQPEANCSCLVTRQLWIMMLCEHTNLKEKTKNSANSQL